MRRTVDLSVLSLMLMGFLIVTACDGTVPTAPVSDAAGVGASASTHAVAASGAPTPVSIRQTIWGDDPCTAEVDPMEHRVTLAGTSYVHELSNGNLVIRTRYTLTTDSGYEGRGTRVVVNNGSIYRAHFNDVLIHPDGRKFRAHAVLVLDLRTDPPTERVLKISGLTCLRT